MSPFYQRELFQHSLGFKLAYIYIGVSKRSQEAWIDFVREFQSYTASTFLDLSEISVRILNTLPWDTHISLRLNFNNFGDPLAFDLMPPIVSISKTKVVPSCLSWSHNLQIAICWPVHLLNSVFMNRIHSKVSDLWSGSFFPLHFTPSLLASSLLLWRLFVPPPLPPVQPPLCRGQGSQCPNHFCKLIFLNKPYPQLFNLHI